MEIGEKSRMLQQFPAAEENSAGSRRPGRACRCSQIRSITEIEGLSRGRQEANEAPSRRQAQIRPTLPQQSSSLTKLRERKRLNYAFSPSVAKIGSAARQCDRAANPRYERHIDREH
jgi:hypothetical protein